MDTLCLHGLLTLFRIDKPDYLTHVYLYIALAMGWPNRVATSCQNCDITIMFYNKIYLYIVSFFCNQDFNPFYTLKLYYLCICTRIDREGFIKVSDFGLSESMYEKRYFRQARDDDVKLPIKWMALESVENAIFSEKTDVVRNMAYAKFVVFVTCELQFLASGHLE